MILCEGERSMMNMKAHSSKENDNIDRITSLPDDVLKHILSFLSTRNAVQTCILSKGWLNTWTSLPDLKFDIKEFGLPEIIDDEVDVELFATKFKLLVKGVLEKRQTSRVNRFELYVDSVIFWPCKAVADCIGDVMMLAPRECSIKLRSREKLNLNTDLIFTCASLIYLELCLSSKVLNFVAIKLNSVNLPCLKTLKLDGVSMRDDSLKKLLLGCSVLEELVLENFNIGIVEICSNTMKNLVLGSYCYVMRLHILTPNLLYLHINLICMRRNVFLSIPSLVDASIHIPGWHDKDKYVTRGLKLIHGLSNVKSLHLYLSCSEGKVKKKNFTSCPVFHHLKYLEIVSWGLYIGFDLASFFLHSPKLQVLTFTNIHKERATEILDEETTLEGARDVLVQREFLQTVRLVGFKNDNGFVDHLINKLFANVKIIGDIFTDDLEDGYY